MNKSEFQKITEEEVEKARYSMMKLLSNGNTLCEFTPSGDFRLGRPITEEVRKKALAEAAEWGKQHAEEQDKERRKLMRLPRKELERILFYYMCIHDKRSLVTTILEQKEEWEEME